MNGTDLGIIIRAHSVLPVTVIDTDDYGPDLYAVLRLSNGWFINQERRKALLDDRRKYSLHQPGGHPKGGASTVHTESDKARLLAWLNARLGELQAPDPELTAEDRGRLADSLDLGTSMLGRLEPDIRARLAAVVEQPSVQTWDDAYSIILSGEGMTTLWKAVCLVDASFVRSGPVTSTEGALIRGWGAYPTRQTLLEAIRFATH